MTEAIALKGGHTTYDRRLDRIPEWHPENDNFPMRRLFAPSQTPRSYTWPVGPSAIAQVFLDQGQEGECVGYSLAHELIAKPVMVNATARTAHDIYTNAQLLDEWPGEDYSGTSVIAGVKYLHSSGYYKSYTWTRDAWELAVAVSRKGPCVIGINWKEGMWEPDKYGFLHAEGQVMGGHAILVKGFRLKRMTSTYPQAAFTLHNSWGPNWGVGGCAYLSLDDMQTLLNEDGEACLPLRTSYLEAIVR